AEPMNHDVSWFFFVARGQLDGGQLYRDFIEPNAPLASLSMIPAVVMGQLLNLGAHESIVINVLLLTWLSYLLCLPSLRRFRLQLVDMASLPIAMLLGFFILPGHNFGQREHLIAVLILPYLLSAALRSSDVRLPLGWAVAAGVLGAFAIGLKPLYLL